MSSGRSAQKGMERHRAKEKKGRAGRKTKNKNSQQSGRAVSINGYSAILDGMGPFQHSDTEETAGALPTDPTPFLREGRQGHHGLFDFAF